MLQIDQLIACLESSVNQQGLLTDKKCEVRCSGNYLPLHHHKDERWCNNVV